MRKRPTIGDCRPSITCCGGGAQHANWSVRCGAISGKQPHNSVDEDTCQPARQRQEALHLVVALFIPQAPLGEVLAVVAEQPITIFTKAGARAARHLCGVKARLDAASDPDRPALYEALERNFFHRAPAEFADH